MSDLHPARRRGAEIAIVVLLAALFILALAQSWAGWFEPIADTGRDLYIPEKIAQGEIKLYRDVSYLYPPLAPYLLAGIVSLFGSSLAVMTFVGIVTGALIALLLYLVGRMTAGIAGAGVLTFLFISLHLTGVSGYSFNFIFPYSHNATFGFLFILLFLYGLLRWTDSEAGVGWLWISIMAGSLAGWSKIEYAAVFVVVLVASFFVRRPRIAPVLTGGVINVLTFGLLGWYFSDAPPERHWLMRNVLPESLLSGGVARQFYARIQGLDEPWTNLTISAAGAVLIVFAITTIAALDRWMNRREPGRVTGAAVLVILLLGLELVLAKHFLFYRGWFLLQILMIPFAIRERKRGLLLLLLVFTLLLGSRIVLRLEPTWYGFLFSIPTEIVFVYVLFRALPARRIYRRDFALLWLPLFLLLGTSSLLNQREVHQKRQGNEVVTSRGMFRDRLPDRAEIFNELFDYLEHRAPSSMVVIPEGLAINWLAKIPTSIPYHTFSPAEMPDSAAQAEMIRAIRHDPPELILLVRRDYGEFGFHGIGIDFGSELINEIECLYEAASYRESRWFYLVTMEQKPQRSCP